MHRVCAIVAFVSFCVFLAGASTFIGIMFWALLKDHRRQKRLAEYLAKVYRAPGKGDGR